jgi:hypothetical protein
MSKSTKYKIIGGFLFLTSFTIQNFMYDYWEGESTEFYNSNRAFSDMIRTSLIYQNLYFDFESDNKVFEKNQKSKYINQSALKIAQGNVTALATSSLAKKKMKLFSDQIILEARGVKDYHSFNQFLQSVNKITQEVPQVQIDRLQQISDYKSMSRFVFVILYIIASILLLLGTYREENNPNPNL